MSPELQLLLATIANLANRIHPPNSTEPVTAAEQALMIGAGIEQLVIKSLAAYRLHTGQPYDLAQLPTEVTLPLDSGDDPGSTDIDPDTQKPFTKKKLKELAKAKAAADTAGK